MRYDLANCEAHGWRIFVRYVPTLLLLVTIGQWQSPLGPAAAENSQSISIALPADFPSETVQISYFLRGPFGGSGGYVKQQAGVGSYQISTVVEGKSADEVRVIVYASGCEIQIFIVPLTPNSEPKRQFRCKPVTSARLKGQIVPRELVRGVNANLVVHYMAYWAHEFYGISDGAVITFEVANASPDASGAFSVDLPSFNDDMRASRQQGGFRLILRDAKTWNPIALNLEPGRHEFQLEQGGLRIQSHYPNSLKFSPRR